MSEDWQVNNLLGFELEQDAEFALSSETDLFLFELTYLKFKGKSWQFERPVSVNISKQGAGILLRLLSIDEVSITEKIAEQSSTKILRSDTTLKI